MGASIYWERLKMLMLGFQDLKGPFDSKFKIDWNNMNTFSDADMIKHIKCTICWHLVNIENMLHAAKDP